MSAFRTSLDDFNDTSKRKIELSEQEKEKILNSVVIETINTENFEDFAIYFAVNRGIPIGSRDLLHVFFDLCPELNFVVKLNDEIIGIR